MKILLLGLNYAPEPIGIAPYSAGMARALVANGHQVSVVSGKPYYPHWEADSSFSGGYRRSMDDGVEITRCPIYIPTNPSGPKRLIHHASFAISAIPILLSKVLSMKPDLVMGIAPSLISAPVARAAARVAGAKLWLHIQDFEVEAAFATGLLNENSHAGSVARSFEKWALRADRISSISPQMCRKLVQKGIEPDKVFEFRNWANIESIRPLAGRSPYRSEWGIKRKHVALYSGNISNKQGIEILVDAATLLAHRTDLLFVICGTGANRQRFLNMSSHLDNILFCDLQPAERLTDLLGLATVHLLPQIAGASDLVLPSKLANMLASGRPVVATAGIGTGLYDEVSGCGLTTKPGDTLAFANAIERLLDDDRARTNFGFEARRRAEERWSKSTILARFEAELTACKNGETSCQSATPDNTTDATTSTITTPTAYGSLGHTLNETEKYL